MIPRYANEEYCRIHDYVPRCTFPFPWRSRAELKKLKCEGPSCWVWRFDRNARKPLALELQRSKDSKRAMSEEKTVEPPLPNWAVEDLSAGREKSELDTQSCTHTFGPMRCQHEVAIVNLAFREGEDTPKSVVGH